MTDLALRGLRWRLGDTTLLDGLDLTIERGAATAIVGPSGCGKSSLLRVIAGIRRVDAGTIEGVPARKAMVFQDAALLPWLTLRQNVALPGRFGTIGDVTEALRRVGLAEHADKLPAALSGGQKMRGSLARALVSRPELVLLDEAFAALDGLTRAAVRDVATTMAHEQGWTTILVTHDLDDATRMCSRIIAVDGPPLRVRGDWPVRAGDADALAAHIRSLYAA